MERFCQVCDEVPHARGLCRKHYLLQVRYGDPHGNSAARKRNVPPDYPGRGRIRCDACGDPLVGHDLTQPCPAWLGAATVIA